MILSQSPQLSIDANGSGLRAVRRIRASMTVGAGVDLAEDARYHFGAARLLTSLWSCRVKPSGQLLGGGESHETWTDQPGVTSKPASTTLPTVERVRWGILGVGNVTERKSGPGFQLAERSELVAVMRRNAGLAADYARRNNVPRWYDDADELINDPEVDAVYVATPPDSHREYAVRVAQAGKPVYVEKPMARTALECEEMISACERAGVGLFVAYYRRALPRFATVKELIDGGRIGQLRSVSIRNERAAQVGGAGGGGWRVEPRYRAVATSSTSGRISSICLTGYLVR